MGAAFIKVGQALSTRPDLIKPDFLEELIKLQDQLPPFDNETAFDIMERELDMPVNQAYKEISPNPVAAASLGQVYRATLHTGGSRRSQSTATKTATRYHPRFIFTQTRFKMDSPLFTLKSRSRFNPHSG